MATNNIFDSKKSILVVDDSDLFLNAAEMVLEPWFDVYTLNNAADYEKLLRNITVDLFILDIEMPEIDGYQLLKKLREMPAYKHTPVIFLSGNTVQDSLPFPADGQVFGFIPKPFDDDMFVKRVCQAIANAPSRLFNT